MEILLYWVLWVLAVSFNLFVVYFIAIFFLKGHKERLHYFQEYGEGDELSTFHQRLKTSDRGTGTCPKKRLKAHAREESLSKKALG